MRSASKTSPNYSHCKLTHRLKSPSRMLILIRASIAGLTALPTDPAVLLSLGGVANQLASALPTSSVLSVLETAAPHSFISNVVNDPSYASSFESAFSAGSSPSWFTALPTDVKSYLHTYTGFAGLASAAAGIQSVTANETTTGSGSSSATGTSGASSTGSGMMSTTSGPSSSGASAASATSSKATTGGAVRPTGALAAGAAGVVGILGLAIAL